MGPLVIPVHYPVADEALELMREVERRVLDVLAAAVNIGSLVTGQGGKQVLADGAEQALDGRLVGGGQDACLQHTMLCLENSQRTSLMQFEYFLL